MSDELSHLAERIGRLEPAAGNLRAELAGCVAVASQPKQALSLIRGVAEGLAKRIQKDIGNKPGAMLHVCLEDLESQEVMSRGLVPAEVLSCLRLAHVLGNKGTHDAMKIEPAAGTVASTLGAVLEVVGWYFCTFARGPRLDRVFAPPAPKPAGPRLSQLPAEVADFKNRHAEFALIVGVLAASPDGARALAIRGMGGIGKTSLAVKAAHRIKDHYPDGQILVELRGTSDRPMDPSEAMSRVIRDFHPELRLPPEVADLVPIYRSTLAGRRVLLVLDNARDEDQVRVLVSAAPPVGVIVTSRRSLALDGVESVPLDVLPPPESLELLRGIVKARGTDEELRVIAESCGRLPLALRVSGDFLRLNPNWSPARYTAAVRDESRRLSQLKGKSRDRDVEAVLGLSARELVRESVTRAEFWQLLSVFPADFDTLAAAAVGGLDEPRAGDELTALLGCSLVQYDPDTDRYSLHDLLRPVARDAFAYAEGHAARAGDGDRIAAAETRFARHYLGVLSRTDQLYLKGHADCLAGLALFDAEGLNIRHAWRWAAEHLAAHPERAGLCRDYALGATYVAGLRVHERQRIAWLTHAAAACTQLGDRSGEGRVLGELGDAYIELREPGPAREFYARWFDIARELGDRRSEGRALGGLGAVETEFERYEASIDYYRQALAAAREVGNRRDEGQALGSIGHAHSENGARGPARDYFRQWLTVATELGDRWAEGQCRGCLGRVDLADGDARAALAHFGPWLAITRQIGYRWGEAAALGNTGHAHSDLGDYAAAVDCYRGWLSLTRELGDRRWEADALANLGVALGHLYRHAEALACHEQRLAIATDLADEKATGAAAFGAAHSHAALGDRAAAIRMGELALAALGPIQSPIADEVHAALDEWRAGETGSTSGER